MTISRKDAVRPYAVKACTLQIKAADIAPDGAFSGYGSVFDVVDSGGDATRPGSFSASLSERKASGDWPRMLLEHVARGELVIALTPIGVWDEIAEDATGLRVKGHLVLDVPEARAVHALMKAGHPYGLSIGYETLRQTYASADDVEQKYGFSPLAAMPFLPSGQVRMLDEVDLWEVSVVTFPMLKAARVDHVKTAVAEREAIRSLSAALAVRRAALARL